MTVKCRRCLRAVGSLACIFVLLALGFNRPVRAQSGDDQYWDERFFSPIAPQSPNLVLDDTGSLFVKSSFDWIAGQDAVLVARWDGTEWYALPSTDRMGHAIHQLLDGGDGVHAIFRNEEWELTSIARWNGSAWEFLPDSNLDTLVVRFTVGTDRTVYAGGGRMDCWKYGCAWAGGTGVWRWRLPEGWTPLDNDGKVVIRLALDPQGGLYAASQVDDVHIGIHWWNPVQEQWQRQGDARIPHTYITGLVPLASDSIYVSGNFAGTEWSEYQLRYWDGNTWTVVARSPDVNDDEFSFNRGDDGLLYLFDDLVMKRLTTDGLTVVDEGVSSAGFRDLEFVVDEDGKIYAGGYFRTKSGAYNLAMLEEGVWREIGPSGLGASAIVSHLVSDGGGIIAFSKAARIGAVALQGAARWDGERWEPFGEGLYLDFLFDAVAGRDGAIYAVGDLGLDGEDVGVVAWDGERWIGQLHQNELDGFPVAATVDGDGRLFIGGRFSEIQGRSMRHVALWDGSTWQALGAGLSSEPTDLTTDAEGRLYATGAFSQVDGEADAAFVRWDGARWEVLSNDGFKPGRLAWAGDVLYAVGNRQAARWDGDHWTILEAENGGGVFDGHLTALTVDEFGHLFVGGEFEHVGDLSANHVAEWNGEHWSPLGSGLSRSPSGKTVYSMAVEPEGEVLIAGDFRYAGAKPSRSLARWTKPAVLAGIDTPNASAYTLSVYPNPLAGRGQVEVSVPSSQELRVAVYDLLGREVAVLHDGAVHPSRPLALPLDLGGRASGVYIVRAAGPSGTLSRSVVHIR